MGLLEAGRLGEVMVVADIAGKEHSIESALDKMVSEWAGLQLGVLPYRETGTYVIKVCCVRACGRCATYTLGLSAPRGAQHSCKLPMLDLLPALSWAMCDRSTCALILLCACALPVNKRSVHYLTHLLVPISVLTPQSESSATCQITQVSKVSQQPLADIHSATTSAPGGCG